MSYWFTTRNQFNDQFVHGRDYYQFTTGFMNLLPGLLNLVFCLPGIYQFTWTVNLLGSYYAGTRLVPVFILVWDAESGRD